MWQDVVRCFVQLKYTQLTSDWIRKSWYFTRATTNKHSTAQPSTANQHHFRIPGSGGWWKSAVFLFLLLLLNAKQAENCREEVIGRGRRGEGARLLVYDALCPPNLTKPPFRDDFPIEMHMFNHMVLTEFPPCFVFSEGFFGHFDFLGWSSNFTWHLWGISLISL